LPTLKTNIALNVVLVLVCYGRFPLLSNSAHGSPALLTATSHSYGGSFSGSTLVVTPLYRVLHKMV